MIEYCNCEEFEWTFKKRIEYDYEIFDIWVCSNCREEHHKKVEN